MSAFSLPSLQRHRTAGFSLVEIMIALVIGMLAMIVILQVFSLFEGKKRTTTSGNDATNTGAIALYELQRNIQHSGYDISAYNLVGCNVRLRTAPATVNLPAMAPVTINHASIPAGDAHTDTLLLVYGNANGGAEGDGITAQANPPDNIYTVQSPNAFHAPVGTQLADYVIAETKAHPAASCSLPAAAFLPMVKIVSVGVGGINNVAISATGQAGMAPGSPNNGSLYNLGSAPVILAYAIRNGQLTVCDYMANDCSIAANKNDTTIWVPIADNIVSMLAEYGHDTLTTVPAATGQTSYAVDTYDKTTPTSSCGWTRTLAVRIALVARNVMPDKSAPSANPTWAGGAIDLTSTSVAPNFTWQNYRYKVFQTTVPIRNIAIQGVLSGC
ncbi:MAG: PilW family protein [Nitrosomonadales bacterium]|nr:PilW family protein [Nitrosomonadales bacterium]